MRLTNNEGQRFPVSASDIFYLAGSTEWTVRRWLAALPLDADIHDVSSAFGTCRTHIDLAFGAVVPRGTVTAASEESDALGWHPVDDLPLGSVAGLAERAARIRRLIMLKSLEQATA